MIFDEILFLIKKRFYCMNFYINYPYKNKLAHVITNQPLPSVSRPTSALIRFFSSKAYFSLSNGYVHLSPHIKTSLRLLAQKIITFNVSSLNLFKYFHVGCPFNWITLNSYVGFFLVGIIILNCVTNLAKKSLKLLMKLDFK